MKKYCVAGASGRSLTAYLQPLSDGFNGKTSLVGLYDINYGRALYASEHYGKGCPVYTDFEKMIEETKPDGLVVCCADYAHAQYIVRGLELGLEVFTEKPMCITFDQVEAIRKAERETGRKIGVCFNMRFYHPIEKLKEIVNTGVLGEIYTVNLDWCLARSHKNGYHGASYYRRWNAEMDKSGGLLVTKATHHFDMVNWLIGQRPVKVSAFGKLRVYGPENAPYTGKRCLDCPHASECEFHFEMDQECRDLFLANEKYDGYMVDSCVFRKAVNIYDCMALNVEYDGGAVMTYSETSTAAYEGFKMSLNGSKARMEVRFFERGRGGMTKDETFDNVEFIRIIDMDDNVTTYPLPKEGEGGHGGSDPSLRECYFAGATPMFKDQLADSRSGADSVLIGIAANESIKTGKIITLREMFKDPTLLD